MAYYFCSSIGCTFEQINCQADSSYAYMEKDQEETLHASLLSLENGILHNSLSRKNWRKMNEAASYSLPWEVHRGIAGHIPFHASIGHIDENMVEKELNNILAE